ncbi:hypothetical protein VN97_g8769 [Penicillium thymicola]|uniref:Uncharacterized protein n=1 Tax=Penicillium thymicola TaxID=293382 RepID=A0AAI9X5N5_PENTH|nr:hypothetical protein VN97_g8769 [Penicillium thymicola]
MRPSASPATRRSIRQLTRSTFRSLLPTSPPQPMLLANPSHATTTLSTTRFARVHGSMFVEGIRFISLSVASATLKSLLILYPCSLEIAIPFLRLSLRQVMLTIIWQRSESRSLLQSEFTDIRSSFGYNPITG